MQLFNRWLNGRMYWRFVGHIIERCDRGFPLPYALDYDRHTLDKGMIPIRRDHALFAEINVIIG